MTAGALHGVRVLDLSRVLAGPSVTQMLADFGADVIKVERPGAGDESRTQGIRPLARPGENAEDSSGFSAVNRGKRSIAVDLARAQGQDLVRALVPRCDILVENFKTGDLARYGLDYASLSELHPGLIYCSITGFGQTGPYARLPGYDLIFQAMSGLMAATGGRQDEPGGGPQRVGFPISDATAGLYATVGILAALHHKVAHGGQGQHIDLALLDAQIAAMTLVPAGYLVADQVPRRVGLSSELSCPYGALDCSDGQIVIAVNNRRQFEALCATLGLPELAADARFATNALRLANKDALMPALAQPMRQRPVAEWRQRLTDAGVPCAPLNDIRQAFDDPQVRHRGVQQQVAHPTKGVTRIVANPLKMSATPVEYRLGPPRVGEHTEEVLRELLSMQASDLQRLASSGAIALAVGVTPAVAAPAR